MYSNLFNFYQEFGATARAKNEALTARATFITGVMEQGYRLWLTLLTTEVTEAVRAAQELTACKTPGDVAEVQAAWFQASSARAITSLQGTVEIANFLIKNLQDSMVAVAPGVNPGVTSGIGMPRVPNVSLPPPTAVAIAAPAVVPVAVAAPPVPEPPPPLPPVSEPSSVPEVVPPAPRQGGGRQGKGNRAHKR